MKHFLKTVGMSVVMAAGLVACGGGGDDSGSKPPPDLSGVIDNVKKVEALSVAQTGVYATVFLGSEDTGEALGSVKSLLSFLSTNTVGNVPATVVPCTNAAGKGSGTFTYSATLSGLRTMGLGQGDKVNISFSNCKIGESNFLFNGAIESTIQSPVENIDAPNWALNYDIKIIQLSVKKNTMLPTIFEGFVSAGLKVVASNNGTLKLSIPTGKYLSITKSGAVIKYNAGISYLETGNLDFTGTATRKLDGDIAVTQAGKTIAFSIATPTPLAGSLTSDGLFGATAGVIDVKNATTGTATSTTFSSSKAVISGSSFSSFDSSWADLAKAL
jgi:hypothetical protein